MAAAEDRAELCNYGGTDAERLLLVQTIVAMANSGGGQIVLSGVPPGARGLDAAALDGLVNRFVGPGLHGLAATRGAEGMVLITVPDSERRPHVTVESGASSAGAEAKPLFHKGQIWVRRGRANAEAGPEDLRRLLFDAAGRTLERFGAQMRAPGFVLSEGDASARPVRLVRDPSAPMVRADPDDLYPLTRQKLCDELGKPYAWVAAAMQRLAIEGDVELSYADRNSAGHPTRWRYAEAVLDLVRRRIEERPNWDPIHEEEPPRTAPAP